MLLDCGATSLVALKRLRLDPNEIETVFVSHLHGDHFGGVPFLILDSQFSRRMTPLKIVGPRGLTQRLRQAMEVMFPGSTTVDRRFRVETVELDPGVSTRVGVIDVHAWEVSHPSGAPPLALRLSVNGKRIAYTGDTAWNDAIVEAAAHADLFIAECYFAEKSIPHH